MSTELTIRERATQAMQAVGTATQLTELAKQSESITAITNTAGRDQCHAARMALKVARVLIEKTGKGARQDATDFQKAVIAEEKRLIAIIAPEETRLETLQTEWDTARENERQARVQAEIDRVSAINVRIGELRGALGVAERHKLTSTQIGVHIADLEAVVVDASFAEFQQQASDAKVATLTRLRELQEIAVRDELDKAELARLRRLEADRQAEIDRAAAIEREAQERQRQEEQTAERQRLADERAAQETQALVLAKEREEIERQRAALAPPPTPITPVPAKYVAPTAPPSLEDMIEVLARHYGADIDTVTGWLSRYDWAA